MARAQRGPSAPAVVGRLGRTHGQEQTAEGHDRTQAQRFRRSGAKLHSENSEMLLKEMQDLSETERHPMFMDRKMTLVRGRSPQRDLQL